MKRLNLFLTLCLFCGLLFRPAAAQDVSASPAPSLTPPLAPAAPFQTPAYTYPLPDFDWTGKFSSRPVVMELFTSLDCLFCPRAEHLLADLVARGTPVVALACHTDPQGTDYPLGLDACTARQERYAGLLADGLLYTPQIVINGHLDAVGYDFDDVTARLAEAAGDPTLPLSIRPSSEAGIYILDLPKTDLSKTGPADVLLVPYRAPYKVPSSQRQSRMRPDPLVHVAARIIPLGSWDGRAKALTFSPALSPDEAGFLILVQGEKGPMIGALDSRTLTPAVP